MTDMTNTVALVTGANRGLGRAFTQELVARGAKVYATARRPETIDVPGVERLRLDVTEPVTDPPADVTLLINNAGVDLRQNLVTGDLAHIHRELDTHLFGALRTIRAFAPVLRGNGGGAILNVLSAMSWFSYDGHNGYAVAKAAAWALTNGVRIELAAQGTQVTGLHVGTIDTDMNATSGVPAMNRPRDVARTALDGVAAGLWEIVVDDWSRRVKASLSGDPRDFYQLPAA